MSFGTAVRTVLGKYATFSGRARRSEFWWWQLAQGLIISAPYVLAIVIVVATLASNPEAEEPPTVALLLVGVMVLLQLALLVPTVAVAVRRLHDTGRSGWWYLVTLVPFGSIVLIVFACQDSTPGHNEHGPNPKGIDDARAYGGPGYGAPGYGAPGYGAPGSPAPQPYGPA